MQQLNLPGFDIKTRFDKNQTQVFDTIRKKYVALTPEEWVRQHFINYMVAHLKYPKGLIAVEHPLFINGVSHRVDIVAFSPDAKPLLIVECKATNIRIDQSVVQQVTRYNIFLKAPYLILTNGMVHFCVRVDFKSGLSTPLKTIPYYNEIDV